MGFILLFRESEYEHTSTQCGASRAESCIYLVGISYLLNQICIDFCSTRFVLISFKSVFYYHRFLHFHHCQWNDFQQNFLLPKLHFYFKTTLYKRRRFVFATLVNKRGTKKVYTGPLFLLKASENYGGLMVTINFIQII